MNLIPVNGQKSLPSSTRRNPPLFCRCSRWFIPLLGWAWLGAADAFSQTNYHLVWSFGIEEQMGELPYATAVESFDGAFYVP